MDLLFEDSGYFDLSTFGLGIGDGSGGTSFAPKGEIILWPPLKTPFQSSQLPFSQF